MGTIKNTLDNWTKLDLESEGMEVVKAMTPEMIKLNLEQLEFGERKDGGRIEPEYSPSYARLKGRKVPDLHVTGDFYRGWKLKVISKNEFEFDSDDWKTPLLVGKYARSVPFFGLNKESITNLIINGFFSNLMNRVKTVVKL